MKYYAPPIELQFEDQKTFFAIPDTVKRLGASISGGLDSSLALFYACKYITENNIESEIVIYPMTGVDKRRPTNKFDVVDIVDLMKQKFPTVQFTDHTFWDNTREWIDGELWRKIDKDRVKLKEYGLEYNLHMYLNGRTSNPPKAVVDEFGTEFEEDRFHDRDRDIMYNPEDPEYSYFYWYRPWENCDKKFIAHYYKENNLMDDLYPLTWSCVEYALKTKWFTEPCGECYWCKEKEWGFGTYR